MSLNAISQALLAQAREQGNFRKPLPSLRVPCSVVSASGPRQDLDDALSFAREVIADPECNLLVVLGEVGSGKSELLRQLASQDQLELDQVPLLLDYAEMAQHLNDDKGSQAISLRLTQCSSTAATEFTNLLASDPSRLLLLIDAFDEINVALHVNDAPPTPRTIEPFIRDGLKTVVAARQSLAASVEAMAETFDAHPDITYHILELGPCELEEVGKALAGLPASQADVIDDYLRRDEHIQMNRARRPLFLQMLMELPTHVLEEKGSLSIYELYDRYVNVALDRDIDRDVTLIPRNSKRRILQNVADEMFDRQLDRPEARLKPDDVKILVTKEIERDENKEWAAAPSGAGHDWVEDFNRSNHLTVESPATYAKSAREVTFVHQSLFEFFLTQHLAARFHDDGKFGLEDDTHSVRAFDSLLPYFFRSQLRIRSDSSLENDLVRLVQNTTTSNIDRLLGLFLLEDSPRILEVLKAISRSYAGFLHEAASQFDSFFMQKVVRYQLTLLDSDIGQALAYVSDVRRREKDKDQDIEVHTFAAGQGPTEFLMARLDNPRLRNARPITVYRLGQFGDERAVMPLKELKASLNGELDPCLGTLIDEAITRITTRERSGLRNLLSRVGYRAEQ